MGEEAEGYRTDTDRLSKSDFVILRIGHLVVHLI